MIESARRNQELYIQKVLKYRRIGVGVTVGNQGSRGNSGKKMRQCEGSEQTTRITWWPSTNGFKTKEQKWGKRGEQIEPIHGGKATHVDKH